MRRKILGIALILLAGLCLCLSLNQADKYRQAEKTYDDILEKYTKEKKVSKKKQDFVVDWKKLWKTNKDVVGWIKMDSGADYPILHGDSNPTTSICSTKAASATFSCATIHLFIPLLDAATTIGKTPEIGQICPFNDSSPTKSVSFI